MTKSGFAVIIPCYNEEKAIEKAVSEIRDILSSSPDHEIIFVNDGSSDKTGELLEKAAKANKDIKVLSHKRNTGYGSALKTGIRAAKHDVIVITDADGTYPNERIPELVALAENHDMVVGARTGDDVEYPFSRKLVKFFLRRYASWMAGQDIPDINSGLRVFHKSEVERFLNILPDGFSFTTTITLALLTNHYSVEYVPISYASRTGKSKIRPIQDTLNFIMLILRTGTYFAPLRVYSPVLAVLSVFFVYNFCHDFFYLDPPHMTAKTLVLMLFTMNVFLFALLADMIDKRVG